MEQSIITEYDIFLLKAGNHYQLHTKLGAHPATLKGEKGTHFAVWAPNARYVAVVGDFNAWDKGASSMRLRDDASGIWELFIPGVASKALYKYFVVSNNGYEANKADPYAFMAQGPPETASIVWHHQYPWKDQNWMEGRKKQSPLAKPVSIYEVHFGSWRRKAENRSLTYSEMADELPSYCAFMKFTHVEFMPVMEHPFYGSWGYQITGYFAPSSRFGTPDEFMYLIDRLHQAGIGVILDWVPSHFPTDEHGLGYFDGTHLYEHADPRKGFHPDWKSFIFNYGRNEVRSFLISNAMYYLELFHIDGLRMDAVTSMLHLDYSRAEGEWIPNELGGRENLEAIRFIQEFNREVHKQHPDVLTIAEESTDFGGVSRPVTEGGLGFDMKWMMGWMHDTLDFFSVDPIFRGYHLGKLTFNIYYAFSERFTLPLSHDEVVYGKHSLIEKMPGDEWQKHANLRLLFTYMFGNPGAKLLFMGDEYGQHHEWSHDFSLDWHEAVSQESLGVQQVVKDLNILYASEKALYERNFDTEGFEWIDFSDSQNAVISWIRKGKKAEDQLIFVANFTPVVRYNYRIGVSFNSYFDEIFNSDRTVYMGSGVENGRKESFPIGMHGHAHSLSLTLPPLAAVVFKREATAVFKREANEAIPKI